MSRQLTCVLCGSVIEDIHIQSPLGERICAKHQSTTFCQGCMTVCRDPAHKFCPACSGELLFNDLQTAALTREVLDWLSQTIGVHSFAHIPVRLVDESRLPDPTLGQTSWRFDGRSFQIDIVVKRGLHPRVFQHTLAHEYGHVLLAADPVDLSFVGGLADDAASEEEGFCEVLRRLWLDHVADRFAQTEIEALERNPDPLYGDGFRRMWPRFLRHGSVVDLRAELLGLAGAVIPDECGKVPEPGDSPRPIVPFGTVLEGGSHRPTVPFDHTPRLPTSGETIVPTAARPTARLALDPSSSTQEPSVSAGRPTITFDSKHSSEGIERDGSH